MLWCDTHDVLYNLLLSTVILLSHAVCCDAALEMPKKKLLIRLSCSMLDLVMIALRMSITMISNNLETADHLADRKEPKNLSSNDGGSRYSCAVEAS